MKFPLFLFAAALFALGGCQKKGSLDLVLEAKMNGQTVATGKKFDYAAGQTVNFQRVSGFFTLVSMTKTDGSVVDLGDFEYLDLTDGPQTLSVAGLDPADFASVRIGFGLPTAINATNPNSLKTSDPRTVNGRGEWWGGWKSYIFSKTEGVWQSTGGETIGFGYHCGSNGIYRELDFSKDFTIEKDAATGLRITFELSDFLKEGGQPLDIFQKPKTSDDADNVQLAKILVGNLATAAKVQ